MKSFCRSTLSPQRVGISLSLCLLMACGSEATDNHQGRADLGDDAPSDVVVERDSDDAIETPAPNTCSDGPLWGDDVPVDPAALSASPPEPQGSASHEVFEFSVASGDPLTDRVILWTRVSPGSSAGASIPVYWEMATDIAFERIAASGTSVAEEARDYTVKVDATMLTAGASYYYRFQALGQTSPIGRTRTAPQGCVNRMRLASVSCAAYARGYFGPYRDIGKLADIDVVLHLGDYIYEYGFNDIRSVIPPRETATLEDYRLRYAHYRRDPDLQALHRQHPVIAVWDDHETVNNAYATGAVDHKPGLGDFFERKAQAYQAYVEWIPIREQEAGKVWRSFQFGDLVDLLMLDTRMWGRDAQVGRSDLEGIEDPTRTILGFDQEDWLATSLQHSEAHWTVVAQQVLMLQLSLGGTPLNTDQWDGYKASRDRFFDAIEQDGPRNTVVLGGDIHTAWAADLTRDPLDPEVYDPESGHGALAVEFITPAVASTLGQFGIDKGVIDLLDWDEVAPHIEYVEVSRPGYLIVDIDKTRTQGAYYHFETLEEPDAKSSFSAALSMLDGLPHLLFDDGPTPSRSDVPPLAP